MLGFDAGGDSARGDRVGFVGEGRVSPPAPPGFGGLYNRFWFGVLGLQWDHAVSAWWGAAGNRRSREGYPGLS